MNYDNVGEPAVVYRWRSDELRIGGYFRFIKRADGKMLILGVSDLSAKDSVIRGSVDVVDMNSDSCMWAFGNFVTRCVIVSGRLQGVSALPNGGRFEWKGEVLDREIDDNPLAACLSYVDEGALWKAFVKGGKRVALEPCYENRSRVVGGLEGLR